MSTGQTRGGGSDRASGPPMSIVFTGPSMKPTLGPLELLEVTRYRGRKVRNGDIVVFAPPGQTQKIAHRVVHAGPDGIRTRGDNSLVTDCWLLSPNDIIGFVSAVRTGGRRRRVLTGTTGRVLSRVLMAGVFARRTVRSAARRAYLGLGSSRFLGGVLLAAPGTRCVSFKRTSGTELQFLIGRHAIGMRSAGDHRWRIKPPFGLLLDESSLEARFGGSTHTGHE